MSVAGMAAASGPAGVAAMPPTKKWVDVGGWVRHLCGWLLLGLNAIQLSGMATCDALVPATAIVSACDSYLL